MLLPGPLKGIFGLRGGRSGKGSGNGGGNGVVQPANPARPQSAHRGRGVEALRSTRPSRGLEQFFTYIRDQSGLTILDLGGATQKNVSFITDLGHRLYSEDFLQILNETFGADGTTEQSNPGRIEYFLKQTLDYPQGQFDG